MYKYQKETIEYLKETRKRLEQLTQEKMKLKIGEIEGEFLNKNGTRYYRDKRKLYFCINHKNGYQDTTFKSIREDNYTSDYGINENDYLKLDKNLFIKLNKFIDKIYKNKHKREIFHEKLNNELQTLNKSL